MAIKVKCNQVLKSGVLLNIVHLLRSGLILDGQSLFQNVDTCQNLH